MQRRTRSLTGVLVLKNLVSMERSTSQQGQALCTCPNLSALKSGKCSTFQIQDFTEKSIWSTIAVTQMK